MAGNGRQDFSQASTADIAGYAFEKFASFRPFELLSENFVIESWSPAVSASLHDLSSVALKAPYIAFEMELDGSGAGVAVTGPGLAVHCSFDPGAGTQQIVVTVNDDARVVASSTASIGSGAIVAVTVTENVVTLWEQSKGHWDAFLTHRLDPESEVDLPAAAGTGHLRAVAVGSPASVSVGYFGHTGLRDPQLVKHMDGSNYMIDGRLLATMTCAGPGPFQTAHWGVFSIDPDNPCDMVQVGHLFFERDGRILGDHAGQIVIEDDGSAIVVVSSWGDFDENVHIRHLRTDTEILSGVHVLSSEPLALPTAFNTWDPTLQHHEGRWWLGFVECQAFSPRFDFRPALARAQEGASYNSEYDYVGADLLHHQTEGTILTQLGTELRLLASDGDAKDYPVYDLQMNRIAQIRAPYESNIPHPLLIDRPETTWMITFDGTPVSPEILGYGTHGDILIFHSRKKP
ncbi:hypothetical protein V3C33_14510 [Micrococcaceae bacterium Sec5.7]